MNKEINPGSEETTETKEILNEAAQAEQAASALQAQSPDENSLTSGIDHPDTAPLPKTAQPLDALSSDEPPVVESHHGKDIKLTGISAASAETKLEILPEVELLTTELLQERKQTAASHVSRSSRSSRKKKHTPAQSASSAALAANQTDASSAEASVETADGKAARKSLLQNPRTAQILRRSLIGVAVVVLGFIVFEAVRLANIVGSVNFVKHGNLFGDTELVVSQSAIASYVSHSDDTKNILLVGYDVDQEGISRSDSMIILTLDHTHKKIKMTSLMRDMYVRIPGYGKRKLNAAFVYGGPELLLQTIYSNFGLQIDSYVCVDYKAFVNVVDYIGGVPVDIEEMELEQFNKYVGKNEKNKIYEAGSYVFNGKQTLSYCRIRKVGSDTARTARQREVLSKIMKKCSKMSLLKLEHLLRITAPAVTTNLSLSDIFSLTAEGLSSMDYEMQGLRIPVDGAWWDLTVDGTSYVGIDLNANAQYLYDFLYGDSETSSQLVERQEAVDQSNEEWERSRYERKKARQNAG